MRECGVLMPITSLPNKYGIGCFSEEAREFIDFLKASGQHYWQILPIGPTGFGDSPYQAYSTFAINPMLIDMESLISEGVLTKEECKVLEGYPDDFVDYDSITSIKKELLKKAYSRRKDHKALEEFAQKEAYWLDIYALFMDIHNKNKRRSFTEWDEEFKNPDWTVVDKYKEDNADDINYYRYEQFKAFEQWEKIKKYANENGIRIIGDIPIYVSPDGADVWINRKLFKMNDKGEMDFIAGCPGDDYAPKGQLWGNPLYDWDYHKETGYEWWISRMKKAVELYDVVRIDHFRGFDEYFSIPSKDDDASNGTWEKGPGMDLFNALKNALGDSLDVIAEDLGFLTDSVRKLRADSGFPGMKVLQFAYGYGAGNEYLPHNYTENSVCYTGTHDNQTLLGWLESDKTPKKCIEHVIEYHGFDKKISNKELTKKLIGVALRSVSRICIIPIQDYMGLDDSARINTPSTVGGQNWKWRMPVKTDYKSLSRDIKKMVSLYGR